MENALIIQRSVFRSIVEMLSARCDGTGDALSQVDKCSVTALVSVYNKDSFRTSTNGPVFATKCADADDDCKPVTCNQKSEGSCESDFSTCVEPSSFVNLCSHRQRVARCASEYLKLRREQRVDGEEVLLSLLADAQSSPKKTKKSQHPWLKVRRFERKKRRDPCIYGRACDLCHESYRSNKSDYVNCNMCARDCERSAQEFPTGKGNECWYGSCAMERGGSHHDAPNASVTDATNNDCAKAEAAQADAVSLLGDSSSTTAGVGWNCG
jgi:hypothetical protein